MWSVWMKMMSSCVIYKYSCGFFSFCNIRIHSNENDYHITTENFKVLSTSNKFQIKISELV